ncbi:GNAT family N-acetyltransferase [Solibacillus sp. FSL K6-1523]|uniref:GNAT family N-acetyltransferase n=1 Tax=Solibacillus sp. FSL K6-1523 TaxID=2921471 RepID=UPI0030FC0D46
MLTIKAIDGTKNRKSELDLINFDEKEKWDAIVKSFTNFDIYYLTSYIKAFEIHGDGVPLLFYYDDENFKAINVVMKRDISNDMRFRGKIESNVFYDIMTPYGYGGFLIEGNVTQASLKKLEHAYCTLCLKEGIISEFVRFHPVKNNSEYMKEIYDISLLGKTITMPLSSQNQILSNLTSEKRKRIRKAKKLGFEIYWGRSPKLIAEFIRLYNSTMENNHAADYYYFTSEFFESILYDLKYNSSVFYAVDNKENIVAMAIFLYINEQINCFLSASNKELDHLALTNLIMYEVACWGSENGYKTLHMGGGVGGKEDSLYHFKKAFNKNSATNFILGKKIFNEEKYGELVEIRRIADDFNEETQYFPIYRS